MKVIAEFEKTAGSNRLQSTEDPSMAIEGTVIPDWVRLPANLGGQRRPVQGHATIACPCGQEHQVVELDLGDRLFVSECPARGFLWYRRREGK